MLGGGARLALAAGGLALLVALALVAAQAHAATEARARPSFVLIQTDDQTLEELTATFTPPGSPPIEAMPNTRELIAERGVTFSRYYTPYSLCAPSRVALMTGRYPHDNNVRGNVQPEGGFSGFARRGAYSHNIATWLQGAGYRTIHIGKFLNGYGEPPNPATVVPPGWSSWHTVLNSDSDHYFYGYEMNNNGLVQGPYGNSGSWVTREYGEKDDPGCPFAPLNGKPCLYETDFFNRLAAGELAATPPETPFYLQLDYTAPHGDFRRPAGPEPPPRYENLFAGARLPDNRAQGFNEGNVNDKPRFIREAPYLSPAEIHTYRVYYEKCLEALRAVDDGVKEIIDTLGVLHRLRNTYVIFTSDNGFFFGQHRLTGGKFLAYQPSTHLPLLMRGPGIRPDTQTGEEVSTVDLAPTILELAGVEPDKSVDGRSLYPYAHDTALRTRRPLLFESFVQTNDVENDGGASPVEISSSSGATASGTVRRRLVRRHRRAPRRAGATSRRRGGGARGSGAARRGHGASASIVAPPKNYYGILLGPYKYIEWPDGEKELYKLDRDPYELNNLVRDPNFFPIRNFLHEELERLETCVGRHCRQVAPKLPLTRRQQLQVKRRKEKERRERQRERERRKREKEKRHHH